MPVSVERVCQAIEEIAPKRLAEDWDNVGLLIGSPSQQVSKILLCLDVTPQVAAYAAVHNYGLLVSHHPVIFRPLKALREDLAQGSLVTSLVRNGIAVYCAHTNWDNAAFGTSHQLANALGLEQGSILDVKGSLKLYKVVVYVPVSHGQAVFESMSKAGAGHIGNYSHCSFRTEGMGTFIPLTGSSPYVGTRGQLEEVQESRLEMVVPEGSIKKVTNAMRKAHPYEEIAYDVIELQNGGAEFGLGKLVTLPKPILFSDFLQQIKCFFPNMRLCGIKPDYIKKIAVCGGSGADLHRIAKARGADVLITGDVGYHVALEASLQGIVVVDAGHYETEMFILSEWKSLITRITAGASVDIDIFQNSSSPFYGMEL